MVHSTLRGFALGILWGVVLVATCPADPITLHLQTRDAASGAITVTPTVIDPEHLGVVAVDVWNWHWCKTATQRVAAIVPRMRVCLDRLRDMGATVFLCPTDVADAYIGQPQREFPLAIKKLTLPETLTIQCPPPPQGPGCACVDRCQGNYGWNAMHPALVPQLGDWIPNDRETLYTLCRKKNITHLLYVGFHTQICLLGKDIGLRNMKALGFDCILARDLTDSHPDYNPERGIDPDDLTARTVAHFERYLCSSVNLKDELTRLGVWRHEAPVDAVRAAPWGTVRRPHIFTDQTIVTLSAPWQPDAEIRFTRDGSPPTNSADRYVKPFVVDRSETIRAQAFEQERPVCIESTFRFERLPPLPPKPDVYLDQITPVRTAGPGHSPSDKTHRFSPGSQTPQKNTNNRGQPLRLRSQDYDRGMGVHAPNHMIYAVDPQWDRFVACVGVDEQILRVSKGSDLGHMPSVIFRVFINGRLAEESPIMRITSRPWRFDVKIPESSQTISIAAIPTDDGNREDLANWVDAGFVTKQ